MCAAPTFLSTPRIFCTSPSNTVGTVSADGQDADVVAAVAHGAVTALVVDPRDHLAKVKEQAALLSATGADLAAIVVVSEPRS